MSGKYLSAAAILLIFSWQSYALDANQPEAVSAGESDATEVEYDIYYDFTPKENPPAKLFTHDDSIQTGLIINLPQTIPGKQEIYAIKFEPEPARIFDQNGNNYAEFKFAFGHRAVKIHVHVEGKVFKYDLATAMERGQRAAADEPNLAVYLKAERMLECNDDLIQRLAKNITGSNEIDIVHNIYHFVISYLDIDVSKRKGVGAAKTANSKKGMCIDYCDLFTAMCRAKGIPARVVAGYQTNFHMTPKHSWVEVYLKEYGWVPFDPTQWKTTNEKDLDTVFYHLKPKYLCFTHTRNDTVLNYDYYYTYPYKDKEMAVRLSSMVESIEFSKPQHKKHDSLQDDERTKGSK